jgi:hypothetical protein
MISAAAAEILIDFMTLSPLAHQRTTRIVNAHRKWHLDPHQSASARSGVEKHAINAAFVVECPQLFLPPQVLAMQRTGNKRPLVFCFALAMDQQQI